MATDLVLLIGTNPLPNYVVGKYLFDQEAELQRIWLVYSEATDGLSGTKKYADAIKAALGHPSITLVPMRNIGNAQRIRADIQAGLLNHLPHNGIIHLNYTGGTKKIGIHTYQTLQSALPHRAKYSYLDARNFKLQYDDGTVSVGDMREHISLDLETLIKLHGFTRTNRDGQNPLDFSAALKKFQTLINESNIDSYYQDSTRSLFRTEGGDLIEKLGQISEAHQQRLNTFLPQKGFEQVLEMLPKPLFTDKGFAPGFTNRELKHSIKFLDGDWLEEHIFTSLKTGFPEGFQFWKNWEITDPNWSNNNAKFELDVIAIRGYQLVGCSCTTSNSTDLCKKKGFEIILRTRQIGGDEAKAILVTRLDDSRRDRFQDELQIDTGSRNNILVLGVNDWKQEPFTRKIRHFLGD